VDVRGARLIGGEDDLPGQPHDGAVVLVNLGHLGEVSAAVPSSSAWRVPRMSWMDSELPARATCSPLATLRKRRMSDRNPTASLTF
jgi:hypothetical protein